MGKFEFYPEANALSDDDITLYNKNAATHKITFGTLIDLIRRKLTENGLVTSIATGVGLLGGNITSTGTIKCNLASETNAHLVSNGISDISNRQYAVTPDKNGRLSVNVPWTEINAGLGLAQVENSSVIKVKIANETLSSLTATTRTAVANREYPVGLDANGNLSVNIPWEGGSLENAMNRGGTNASDHVNFPSALTIGDRTSADNIGENSVAIGSNNTASGSYALVQGQDSSAYGNMSVAEGMECTARGLTSHAYGACAETLRDYQFVFGGASNKFNTNNVRGMFGVNPDGKYYITDTEITNSKNGCGGTVLGGVTITLSLDLCAMYMLYWTSYGTPTIHGIIFISTSRVASGTPHVSELTDSSILDSTTSNNKIIITDNSDYMFHLVRIM